MTTTTTTTSLDPPRFAGWVRQHSRDRWRIQCLGTDEDTVWSQLLDAAPKNCDRCCLPVGSDPNRRIQR